MFSAYAKKPHLKNKTNGKTYILKKKAKPIP